MKTSLKKSQTRHASINLESLKLKRLHSINLDDDESSIDEKNKCIHIHVCARFLLMLTLVLSIANIIMLPKDEYRDFKTVASIFDNCVIVIALIGNFWNYRLAYWPFFIVHAIFIGTLAILSTSLLVITIRHASESDRRDNRLENKEERLLLMLGFTMLQFVIHSYIYIKAGYSYRYLGAKQREKDALRMPDLLVQTKNGNFFKF